MSGDVLRLVPAVSGHPDRNDDAIQLVEGLLERLRSGEALAVAIVEVQKGGNVATAFSKGLHYHALNSGAARLAARLALD